MPISLREGRVHRCVHAHDAEVRRIHPSVVRHERAVAGRSEVREAMHGRRMFGFLLDRLEAMQRARHSNLRRTR